MPGTMKPKSLAQIEPNYPLSKKRSKYSILFYYQYALGCGYPSFDLTFYLQYKLAIPKIIVLSLSKKR
jgi:hypothetical protein